MGCTNAKLKDLHEHGYKQKETLYYKIKDKKVSSANDEDERNKPNLNKMESESLSSENSSNNSSDEEGEMCDQIGESNVGSNITKISVLYLHKPARPSKLKEILRSNSKYDYSDARSDILSVNKSDMKSDNRSDKENIAEA